MAHVRFTADFDYRVPRIRATVIAYKAGWSGPVTRDCSRKAIAAGKAVAIPAPARPKKDAADA